MVSRHQFSWQQTPLGQPARPQGVQRRMVDKGRKLDPIPHHPPSLGHIFQACCTLA